jgi:branched-chain amino acid aminotransferase
MSQSKDERVAYFNGKIVAESEVLVPFRDRGFIFGDAAFDMTRTFGHRIYKLEEHLERFYRSMRYLQLDPRLELAELASITEEVLERNLILLAPDDDYWVAQRGSRGGPDGPTVIVECSPLPLAARAHLYRDGVRVVVPALRRVPPESLSPRAKTHNYLNLVVADLEAKAVQDDAWAILLDTNGNLSEGLGSNIFLVSNGEITTPQEKYVLPGISRQTVMELARELDLALVEKDIDLFDAYNAEEAFLSSTSLCICPVQSINGRPLNDGSVPGPLTKALSDAYAKSVGFDFVQQYKRHLA